MKVSSHKSCQIDHYKFHLSFYNFIVLISCLIVQHRSLAIAFLSSATRIANRHCCRYPIPTTTTTSITTSKTINTATRALYHSSSSYYETKSNDQDKNRVIENKETPSNASIESNTATSSLKTTNTNYIINMSIKAIGSSTTIVVSGLFFIVLAYKRNTQMISFFIGAIMNGVLSKVLKKLIQQTRPIELYQSSSTSTGVVDIPNKPTDHGMPSSHAMSLGFIATFIACNIISLRIPLLLYTIISLYYRVQVRLHTYQQVVVGTILGSTNGYFWYRLCNGNNPFNIHIMNLVKQYLFHNKEQLPIPYLIVPLLVGAATIGSFERRISALLRKKKKADKE